jgi:hypothetical protein
MSPPALRVLAVVGSLQKASITRVVISFVAERLTAAGCSVDLLDFCKEPLALYNPEVAHDLEGYLPSRRGSMLPMSLCRHPGLPRQCQQRYEEFSRSFLA